MGIKEAIELIKFTPGDQSMQIWADLGCGEGVFTKALATLLPAGSLIRAIDLDEKAIKKIPGEFEGVVIEKTVMDFTSRSVVFQQMDGILMANSLHYIKDKASFLARTIHSLKPNGHFLLVDYDMNRSNPWVPYPIPIAIAEELFLSCGASAFSLLKKRKSVFGDRWMYAALVRK